MEAKWVLSYPSGRASFVCDQHMSEHAKNDNGRPRCDEYRAHPSHKPPECDDCEAKRANART